MTRFQKIKEVVVALFTIALSIVLFVADDYGYLLIIVFLSLSLVFMGIKELAYFFSMARFMVGGKIVLYKGIFFLDIGIFTSTLLDLPESVLLIYLAIIHGFTGLVEILRVIETLKYGSKSWKLKFSHGLIDVFLAVACIAFSNLPQTAVYIYCFGLLYSSLIKIISAFRKTTFVYIQ
ncbi:hypothetical protein [Butyrivibrio sp. VCB2006]|uniref:hypothetical protein n=1 Tax=Butyrivibrio sp. VCB2006 TaxID=1280679 RepID=UPI00040943C0|nr:hypothetical protein [Butyrivibrio sp. VCB2006]